MADSSEPLRVSPNHHSCCHPHPATHANEGGAGPLPGAARGHRTPWAAPRQPLQFRQPDPLTLGVTLQSAPPVPPRGCWLCRGHGPSEPRTLLCGDRLQRLLGTAVRVAEGDTLFPSLSLNWLLAVPQGSWPRGLARARRVSPLQPRRSPPGCGTRPPRSSDGVCLVRETGCVSDRGELLHIG